MMRRLLLGFAMLAMAGFSQAADVALLEDQAAVAALVPEARENAWWKERHAQRKVEAEASSFDVVLLGDSITHYWERYPAVWNKYFGDVAAINLGFSADRTGHVLWRIANGALDNLSPELVVLLIGTNNTGQRYDPAADTAAGIKAILDEVQNRLPGSRVLLLAVFPCGRQATDRSRIRNNEINDLIEGYADNDRVFYLDINSTFLAGDKSIPPQLMPDALHPGEAGYAVWAEAMSGTLHKLLRDEVVAPVP